MAKKSKIILITGCSSGFGLLMAVRLAANGHQVIATMRDLKKKGALEDEAARRKAELKIMRLDVTDAKSIADCVAYIGQEFGCLDVLINNAGYGISGFFEDLSEAEIRQQMETNFFGVQNVTRAVIPFMRPRREGKIINISSVSGFNTYPAFSAYSASKWALEAFSEALMYEMKLFDIDVHLIQPGMYKTKIFYENAHFARDFDNKESPYYEISQFFRERTKANVDDCHKDNEEIAILAEKLINSRRAPFRVIPDIESQFVYLLRKYLPFRLYSGLITRGALSKFKKK